MEVYILLAYPGYKLSWIKNVACGSFIWNFSHVILVNDAHILAPPSTERLAFLSSFSVWKRGVRSLIEVTSINKTVNRSVVGIHLSNGLTEENCEGIYLALGNPRQARRLLQPKQEAAHPQLCHTNASGGDLNIKWSMRHVEREPSYKLQKKYFVVCYTLLF